MSFWNNHEYDGFKMILIAVLVTGVGLFVFNQMKIKPLENSGRVITASKVGGTPGGSASGGSGGSGTGGNPGGGTGKGGSGNCDQSIVVTLAPSYVTGSAATSISLNPATSGIPNTNVNLGTFRLTNSTPCPMNLTQMKFVSHPSTVPSPTYSMIQNINLIESSTGLPFGVMLPFTSPVDSVGVLPFTSTSGAIVPAFGTADFTIFADGRNVPTGRIAVQLTEFTATNTITGMPNHEVYPASMGIVTSPAVRFVP